MQTMTTQRICKDWKGVSRVPPEDFETLLAIAADGYIVWTKRGEMHRVRYGLQATNFADWHDALRAFGDAMSHNGTGF